MPKKYAMVFKSEFVANDKAEASMVHDMFVRAMVHTWAGQKLTDYMDVRTYEMPFMTRDGTPVSVPISVTTGPALAFRVDENDVD